MNSQSCDGKEDRIRLKLVQFILVEIVALVDKYVCAWIAIRIVRERAHAIRETVGA
jgi:hypothetical protein